MTVSEQIIQVLNALCSKFGIVVDWTNQNVIPYLNTLCGKLVTYEIWTSVAWMAIMGVLSIIFTILVITLRNKIKESLRYFGDNPFAILIIVASIIIWMATIVVIGVQIFDIIKCVSFPELYVFEYVQSLVESGK